MCHATGQLRNHFQVFARENVFVVEIGDICGDRCTRIHLLTNVQQCAFVQLGCAS